jgi:hypothetical protein
LGREAVVLDDLELNQTPHHHKTQSGQEDGDHCQPALDGFRGGVAGFGFVISHDVISIEW